MLMDGINGFMMALADSVPGVSGGTVAFVMGFYDRFITSIDRLISGSGKERKDSLLYLLKLGIGWGVGMILAVLILSNVFEKNIYGISSLFVGFIAGAIPLVIHEERKSVTEVRKGIVFGLLGIAIVVAITVANGKLGVSYLDLSQFSGGLAIRLFFIGLIAISAMFLPGISGSTLLLIFGAYMPVIAAVKNVISLHFSYAPALLFFGMGVLTGAVTIVKLIRYCLEHFRPQTIYFILGMMIGSFYAIGMGPTTLKTPHVPVNIYNFSFWLFAAGILLVFGLQWLKVKKQK